MFNVSYRLNSFSLKLQDLPFESRWKLLRCFNTKWNSKREPKKKKNELIIIPDNQYREHSPKLFIDLSNIYTNPTKLLIQHFCIPLPSIKTLDRNKKKKKRKCNFSAEERRKKWKQQLWNKIFWCILSDRVGYRAVFTLQSKIHLHYGIETRDRICYSNGATLLKMAEPSANGGSFVPSLLPDKTLPIFFLTLFHSSLKKNSSHTHLIISKKTKHLSLYPFIQYFLQYQSRSSPK